MAFSTKELALIAGANAKARASGKPMFADIAKAQMQASKRPAVQAKLAKIKTNVAKDRKAEVEAAASNTAKLAAMPKAAPTPKPQVKGSGALVGVAQGACDGQPHTKLAVAQARTRALAEQRGDADAVLAKLAQEAETTPLLVMGIQYPSKKAAAAKRALVRASVDFAGSRAPADPSAPSKAKKAAPAKAAKQPQADRTYAKGKVAYEGKAGTWTHYMVALTLKHKSTNAAKAAHAATGQFPGKALDFKWMTAKGYIA